MWFPFSYSYFMLWSILFLQVGCSVGQIMVPTNLERCEKGSDVPSSVHVLFVDPLTPSGTSFLGPSIQSTTEIAIDYFNLKVHYGQIELTGSTVQATHLDLPMVMEAAIANHSTENIVGILGTTSELHNSVLTGFLSQRAESYIHQDIMVAVKETEELQSYIDSYDYVTALVFARSLASYGVTRCAILQDKEAHPWTREFTGYGLQLGIEIEVIAVVTDSDFNGTDTRAAVHQLKQKDIRYVILDVSLKMATLTLAHACEVGLSSEAEKPVTWVGDIRLGILTDHTANSRLKQFWDQRNMRTTPFTPYAIAQTSAVTFENITELLDGSFHTMHHFDLSNMGREFFAETLAATGSSRTVESFSQNDRNTILYGDAYLAFGYAVNALNYAGYGCYLHQSNFSREAALTLYEFQKQVLAEGFSGILEYNSGGDRILREYTWFGCSFSHHHSHSTDSSSLGCVPHQVFDGATGELLRDNNHTIFWHGGSSTPPSPPPSDGRTFPSSPPLTIEVITNSSKHVFHEFWIPIICSIVGMFLFTTYLLHLRIRKWKRMLQAELEAKAVRVLELDSPFTTSMKLLERIIKGENVSKEEAAVVLNELAGSWNVMEPNLSEKLSKANHPYNRQISMFLLQNTQHQADIDSLRHLSEERLSYFNSFSGPSGMSSPPQLSGNPTPSCGSDDESPRINPNRSLELPSMLKSESVTSVDMKDEITPRFNVVSATQPHDLMTQLLLNLDEHYEPALQIMSFFNKQQLGRNLMFNILDTGPLGKFRNPLLDVSMHLVIKLELLELVGLSRARFAWFVQSVEGGYSDGNSYHNQAHAADVTQRLCTILCQSGLYPSHLSHLDLLAALIAAIVHDYDHPGKNNAFMVNSQHQIAKQHNDQHVLENHSLVVTLGLLDLSRLLEPLDPKQALEVRKTVIHMVLATDMAEHFRVVSQFSQKVTREGLVSLSSPGLREDQRVAVLQMAVKVADLGHTTLMRAEHVHWVNALQDEFFQQGDEERKLKMEISPLCDRRRKRSGPASGENQIGFFEIICEPLISSFVTVFPSCDPILQQLRRNYSFWLEDANRGRSDLKRGKSTNTDVVVEVPQSGFFKVRKWSNASDSSTI